jgi:hypothetical protein
MDEFFTKHYEALEVKDGNFYNEARILPAIQYFSALLEKGDDVAIVIPLFKKLLEKTSGKLEREATFFLINFYIRSQQYSNIFRLNEKIFPSIFNELVLRLELEDDLDIYPLLVYILEHKILEIYQLNNSFKNYFDNNRFLENRINRRLEIAEKIVEKEIKSDKIADLVYHLLSKYFPIDCFRSLKKLLYQKPHAFDSMRFLLHFLPEYHKEMEEDIGYIESLSIQSKNLFYWNYAAYNRSIFLMKYYFYKDDIKEVEALSSIIDHYSAPESIHHQLAKLLVKHPEKTEKYLPVILNALGTDIEFNSISLNKCFETLRSQNVDLGADFIKNLSQNLDNQNYIRLSLVIFQACQFEPAQLKKIDSKNPYFLALIHHAENKEAHCNFCASNPMDIYQNIDSSKIEIQLQINGENVIHERGSLSKSWAICKNCKQDYIYSYEETFDLIYTTHENLNKTNPIRLLKKIKDPEALEKIKASYPKKLAKAQKDIYSPFLNLRMSASEFLVAYYIEEKDEKGLQEFLKIISTDCLYVALELIYNKIIRGEYFFADMDYFNSLSVSEYCQAKLGKIVAANLMIKNNQSAIAALFDKDDSMFLKGALSAFTSKLGVLKNFEFLPEIFERVYQKGLELKELDSYHVDFLVNNYFSSDRVNVSTMLQTLEKTEDMVSILFLIQMLNRTNEMLPALNESLVKKLLKISTIKEAGTMASDFLYNVLVKNNIQKEALSVILDYLIDNKVIFYNEYLLNVLNPRYLKPNFINYLFKCLKSFEEPYFWMNKFNDLLKYNDDYEVQKILITTIEEFAEKGIDIQILLEELLKKMQDRNNLFNEKIRQIIKKYYEHYNHSYLLPYIQ